VSRRYFSGIKGLVGREPVGAILRVGRKGSDGYPVDRNRFFIAKTTQDKGGRKPMHPAFSTFNNRGSAEACSTVRLAIMHGTPDQCFEAYLRCHKKPNVSNRGGKAENPPNQMPWCTGDGMVATRWDGETFVDQHCLNEQCPLRQPGSGHRGQGRACKPHTRLLAQLIWGSKAVDTDSDTGEIKPFPTTLIRFTSNSWNTASNLKGYFGWWDQQAINATKLGADLVDFTPHTDDDGKEHHLIHSRRYSMVGARVALTVAEKADQDPRTGDPRRYPVVTIAPLDDPVQHMLRAAEAVRLLRDEGRAAVAMLTDTDHTAPRSRTGDYLMNEPGTHTEGTKE